jgi:hypothetical protein
MGCYLPDSIALRAIPLTYGSCFERFALSQKSTQSRAKQQPGRQSVAMTVATCVLVGESGSA